jgi:hypothetical protein
MESISNTGDDELVNQTWQRIRRGFDWNMLTPPLWNTKLLDELVSSHIEKRISQKCLHGAFIHYKEKVNGINLPSVLTECAENPKKVWDLLHLMKEKGWIKKEKGLDSWFFKTCDNKMPHVFNEYDRELLIQGATSSEVDT